MICIQPYKPWSRSAKELSKAMGVKRWRPGIPLIEGDTVINWGARNPVTHGLHYLNHPTHTSIAGNKLFAFNKLADAGVSIPDYWTKKEDIPDDAFPIVCRTILSGHSGAGIVIAHNRGELVDCSLYVRYVKKQDEYRVHIGKRDEDTYESIAIQKKARRLDHDNPDWRIRNHQNGFVYKREGVVPPAGCLEEAFKAIDTLCLDFGAVDIIYNEKSGRCYVLEVNTAPGLEGQTVADYASFFKQILYA